MKYLDFLKLYFDAEEGTGDEGGTPESDTKGGQHEEVDERDKPKYSENDVDKMMAKRNARFEKEKQKVKDEATRLATMTAQERAEHERDEMKKELDALKRANAIAEMEKEARKILNEDGINVSDDLVSVLVSDNADDTSNAVKAFSKAFKSAVQKEVKKQLSHKKPTTGAAGTLTKEDILNEKDPLKRQKLIRENMNLFR